MEYSEIKKYIITKCPYIYWDGTYIYSEWYDYKPENSKLLSRLAYEMRPILVVTKTKYRLCRKILEKSIKVLV
jgi:hypothetical protein